MANKNSIDSDLIDLLGKEFTAKAFRLSPQALYNWRTRGIPVTKRIAFARLCAERGVPTPQDFFSKFEVAA